MRELTVGLLSASRKGGKHGNEQGRIMSPDSSGFHYARSSRISNHCLVTVAQSLAKEDGANVVVAHVNELMAGRDGAHSVHPNEDLLRDKVRMQVADLKAARLDAEIHMQSTIGKAAKSIAKMAIECHADLIVADASRHGPFADLVFGTAGQRMYRSTSGGSTWSSTR